MFQVHTSCLQVQQIMYITETIVSVKQANSIEQTTVLLIPVSTLEGKGILKVKKKKKTKLSHFFLSSRIIPFCVLFQTSWDFRIRLKEIKKELNEEWAFFVRGLQ